MISLGFERLRPPANLPSFTAVTVGDTHACGITAEGTPVCWGENVYGQLDIPDIDTPIVKINAGANHTCAIDNTGDAVCWGLNTNDQLIPPAGSTFIEIDAVENSTCGILANGDITCWTTDNVRAYERLEGPYTALDTASRTVCGLTETGSIECFTNNSSVVTPPSNGPYIDLAVNRQAICGLRTDGALDCSFTDTSTSSQFPVGDQFTSIHSVESDTGFTSIRGTFIKVVDSTMCGERLDGEIDCWAEGGNFPNIDNTPTTATDLINNLDIDLDARIYDTKAVEIFWTPLPFEYDGTRITNQPNVEIYRNGELIDTVLARFSYFDRSATADATYQVRLVDDFGNAGELSGTLTVSTESRTVLYNGEPTVLNPISAPQTESNVITDYSYAGFSEGFVVGWTVDSELEGLIDGYEVLVNGVSLAFTRSKLFVSLDQRGCVDIVAYGFDGARIGSTRLARGGTNCN